MSVKGFSDKQKPIAIGSVIIVIAVMVCILIFGKTTVLPSKEDTSADTTKTTSAKAKETTTEETTTEYKRETTTEGVVQGTGNSAIILQGTRCMELWGYTEESFGNYISYINSFAGANTDKQVYVLIAPTSLEFYSNEAYHTGRRSQKDGLADAYSKLSGSNIKKVDVYKELERYVDSEYIYFRTDHHWTARGAYHAYTVFADVAGFKATDLSKHETGKLEGFVGSYYSYTALQVLKDNPDYVEYFMPLCETTATYWNGDGIDISTGGTSFNVVDPQRIIDLNTSSSKYLCFIAGDNGVEKIVTTANTGRKIVVIKESYGNSFVPFLCDNYDEVYVLDPRKLYNPNGAAGTISWNTSFRLDQFMNDNGIEEVLFLNYSFAPSNPTYMTGFKALLGVLQKGNTYGRIQI